MLTKGLEDHRGLRANFKSLRASQTGLGPVEGVFRLTGEGWAPTVGVQNPAGWDRGPVVGSQSQLDGSEGQLERTEGLGWVNMQKYGQSFHKCNHER